MPDPESIAKRTQRRLSEVFRHEAATAAALAAAAVTIYFALDWTLDLPPYALQFRSEIVRAEPDGQSVTFAGEYHFLAHHHRRRAYKIAFPFRASSADPVPEQINAVCDGQPLSFTRSSQGIEFELRVTPRQETTVTITYTLPAPNKSATYITRTANLWPMPLENAQFVVPDGIESNYHCSGQTSASFVPFRPREDWRVRWR